MIWDQDIPQFMGVPDASPDTQVKHLQACLKLKHNEVKDLKTQLETAKLELANRGFEFDRALDGLNFAHNRLKEQQKEKEHLRSVVKSVARLEDEWSGSPSRWQRFKAWFRRKK